MGSWSYVKSSIPLSSLIVVMSLSSCAVEAEKPKKVRPEEQRKEDRALVDDNLKIFKQTMDSLAVVSHQLNRGVETNSKQSDKSANLVANEVKGFGLEDAKSVGNPFELFEELFSELGYGSFQGDTRQERFTLEIESASAEGFTNGKARVFLIATTDLPETKANNTELRISVKLVGDTIEHYDIFDVSQLGSEEGYTVTVDFNQLNNFYEDVLEISDAVGYNPVSGSLTLLVGKEEVSVSSKNISWKYHSNQFTISTFDMSLNRETSVMDTVDIQAQVKKIESDKVVGTLIFKAQALGSSDAEVEVKLETDFKEPI